MDCALFRDEPVVLFGRTLDRKEPVDYLKEFLLSIYVAEFFKEHGRNAQLKVVMADHFVAMNGEMSKEGARQEGMRRIGIMGSLAKAYGVAAQFVLTSDLSAEPTYQNIVSALLEKAEKQPPFRQMLMETIPEGRLGEKDALRYPIEELAVIIFLGTDIKVGPIYEKNYDSILRAMGYPLKSIYTTPHGVAVRLYDFNAGYTPYHGRTDPDFRLFFEQTTEERRRTLQRLKRSKPDGSQLSDLESIAELARERVEGTKGCETADNEDLAALLERYVFGIAEQKGVTHAEQ